MVWFGIFNVPDRINLYFLEIYMLNLQNFILYIFIGVWFIGFVLAIHIAFVSNRELKKAKSVIKSQNRMMAQSLDLYNMALAREKYLLEELEKKGKHV